MADIGQIIRQRREALGLTLAALAREVGSTKSYLSMIENRRVAHPPSRTLLAALERALEIAPGELVRAAAWQETPPELRAEISRLSDAAQRGADLAHWLRTAAAQRPDGLRSLDKLFASGELAQRIRAALDEPAPRAELDAQAGVRYRVPVINQVAAGYPRDFTDLDYPTRVADEFIHVPDLADPSAFACRVCGDSMQPDYREGDIVVFSPAAKVTDGCDCFVRLLPEHETTFKRIFFDPGPRGGARIRLQPLNPRFPPVTFKREQVAGLYRAVARYQRL